MRYAETTSSTTYLRKVCAKLMSTCQPSSLKYRDLRISSTPCLIVDLYINWQIWEIGNVEKQRTIQITSSEVFILLSVVVIMYIKCYKCYCLAITLRHTFSLSFVNSIKDMTANYYLAYLRMIDKWLLIMRRPIVLQIFLLRLCYIKIRIIFLHGIFAKMTS